MTDFCSNAESAWWVPRTSQVDRRFNDHRRVIECNPGEREFRSPSCHLDIMDRPGCSFLWTIRRSLQSEIKVWLFGVDTNYKVRIDTSFDGCRITRRFINYCWLGWFTITLQIRPHGSFQNRPLLKDSTTSRMTLRSWSSSLRIHFVKVQWWVTGRGQPQHHHVNLAPL